MTELYVLLPALEDDTPLFAWRSGGRWQCAPDLPPGRFGRGQTAVAIVPGVAVTEHHVDIMARKPAEARRVAAFAVEDDVAEPVENLHVALGPVRDGITTRTVHVAASADMRGWMTAIEDLGLPDADIVAAHACLPHGTIAAEGPDELLLRSARGAFALDAGVPDDLVQSLAPHETGTVHGHRLAALLGQVSEAEAARDRAEWLLLLAGWESESGGHERLSLRQGEYAVRRPLELGSLSRWKLPAALAACAGLTWLGSVWLETSALNAQEQALRTRTADLLAAAVPEAGGSLPAALAQLQTEQRSAAGALRPTMASAALYEAIGAAGNTEIRSLRFDGSTGRLAAQVLFDNYAEADSIGQRLEDSGLAVSLGEARQSGGRVLGEFVIEAAS